MPIRRPRGIVAVDATSAAGALPVDPAEFDVYYFALQKAFAGDGGLWLALLSPAAVERVDRIAASGRWIPAILDLRQALDNSAKDQTLNTPALATLFLADQLDWLIGNGGMAWSAKRCEESAGIVYGWAEASPTPGRSSPTSAMRSNTVHRRPRRVDRRHAGDGRPARERIVDTEPYRKLGCNQLRLGMYPAVEPDDLARLTRSVDRGGPPARLTRAPLDRPGRCDDRGPRGIQGALVPWSAQGRRQGRPNLAAGGPIGAATSAPPRQTAGLAARLGRGPAVVGRAGPRRRGHHRPGTARAGRRCATG